MTTQPRPSIQPPAGFTFPVPVTRELPNGLTVWSYRLTGQHVVSALLVLDLPLDVEPAELEGIATIAVRASDEGTLAHPGQELLDEMEAAGAAFEASAAANATILGIDVPSTRLARALPLLAEIARTPAHADTDVQRHVALRLAELEQSRISAPSLASLAFRQALYDPASRVQRPFGGREATVAAITPEQVRAFRAAHWGPEGATLILAGEFDEGLDDTVEELFGTWQAPVEPLRHVVPLPSAADQGRVVHLVDLPGAVQTEIRIGGIGVDRTSRDFAPLQVSATALGGSFGSRLNTVLREEKGFTYGAHMGVQPNRLGGTWSVQTSVRNAVTAEALTDALDILTLTEAFTAEEITDATSYQLGIAPLRYDTAGAIANQAGGLAAAGWTSDFVNLHFARIAQVTADTATEAARRILALDRAKIVLVGDASELTGQLEAAGFTVEPLVVNL